MADDEPNWQLLPHEPEKFFGLAVGWERRELKRCYNRFIKRYRPEKEPEKFRQIRAAYEELTEELEWRKNYEAESGLVEGDDADGSTKPTQPPEQHPRFNRNQFNLYRPPERPPETPDTESTEAAEDSNSIEDIYHYGGEETTPPPPPPASPINFDKMDPPEDQPKPRLGVFDYGRMADEEPVQPPEPEFEVRVPVDYSPPNGDYSEYDDYQVHWGRARTQVLGWLEAGLGEEEILRRLEAEPREFRDAENIWMRTFVTDMLDPTGWRFFETLIEEIPRDNCPLIKELFVAFLENRDDGLDTEMLLSRASGKLSEEHRYTLLMPLWLELFDYEPDKFWKLFNALQPSFNLHQQYLAFILRLISLRGMQMRVHQFHELFEQVDSQHDQLPMMMQEHLDFMHAFAVYREASAMHPADTDGLRRLQEAIIDFADLQSDWKIARTILIEISQNMNHEWFNANFPVGHPLLAPACEITMIMSHELGLGKDQLMEDFERPDLLNNRLNRHLHAAFQTTDDLPTAGNVWLTIFGRLGYKVFLNFAAPIGLCLLIQKVAPEFFQTWSVLIVLVALVGFILSYKYKLHEYEYRIGLKAVMDRDRIYYHKYWRLYLLDFIGQNKATTTIIFNLLRMSELPDTGSLFEFASQDPGLGLYSALSSIDPNAPERRWRYAPF